MGMLQMGLILVQHQIGTTNSSSMQKCGPTQINYRYVL